MDLKEGSRPDDGDLISVRVNVDALVVRREDPSYLRRWSGRVTVVIE